MVYDISVVKHKRSWLPDLTSAFITHKVVSVYPSLNEF